MAPSSVVLTPTGVTSTQATLRGEVNPDGSPSRAYFEYGETTGYGTSTTPVDVGGGSSPVAVSRQVTGLTPGHLFNYRCVLDTSVVPPPVYGALLPTRMGASSGTVIPVTTLAQLTAARSSANPNDIVRVDAVINGGGAQMFWNPNGSAGAPITLAQSGAGALVNFSQFVITGTYLRILGLPIHGCALANYKITDAANHIEIDGCETYDSAGMGILITASAANWQIWNCDVHDNGSISQGNKDHGIYAAYARPSGACGIFNTKSYHNCAYNIQVYPDDPGLIMSCNVVDDGMVHAESRGGMVVGSNPGSPQTVNVINVGLIATRAARYGVSLYNPGPGNNTYDSIGFDNGLGDFQAGSGMTYTRPLHADPDFVDWDARDYHLNGGSPAIDYIDPARYGYVPPTDIDGTTRVTADAGCYAA